MTFGLATGPLALCILFCPWQPNTVIDQNFRLFLTLSLPHIIIKEASKYNLIFFCKISLSSCGDMAVLILLNITIFLPGMCVL